MLPIPNTITIDTTSSIAADVWPFVSQLCQDNLDGQEWRWATGYWKHSPRPIIDNLAGDLFRLLVEGPIHVALGIPYPLGGLLATAHGWTSLDPVETSLLVFQLRRAIDAVIQTWFDQYRSSETCTPEPRSIDREIDDAIAQQRISERARIVSQFMRSGSHD
jgi:hypothetical protein